MSDKNSADYVIDLRVAATVHLSGDGRFVDIEDVLDALAGAVRDLPQIQTAIGSAGPAGYTKVRAVVPMKGKGRSW